METLSPHPVVHQETGHRPFWPGKIRSEPCHLGRANAAFYLLRSILFVGCILIVLMAEAIPDEKQTERRRVAVVLSGGGTKGMAHIGVLKALEENDIPIDYIAGTSIGAIIGGMYAAGYSPEEIELLVLSEEFKDAAVGRIDDRYRQYYLEPEPDPSWVNLYFGWDDRLEPQNVIRQNIPSNIVAPYLMDFLFMEYLGPAGAAANFHFDNLFVPFRCIATDVESRSARTMRDGSLPDAVRASMTFPFYFQPIEIDGRLMMDGGMFNNFPADVVHKEFQPDVVIGSVVSDNPGPPKRDDIVSQLENLLQHPTRYDILTDQGVLIKPPVPDDIAVNDMSRNRELIDAGYEETLYVIGDIHSLVQTRMDRTTRDHQRALFRNNVPDKVVGEINVTGLSIDQQLYVMNALDHESLPMTFEQLKNNYFSMLLNNRFDYAYPYLSFDRSRGLFIFNLEMEKTREFLRSFGGNISSRPVSHIFAKLEYSRWGNRPLTFCTKTYFGNFYNSIGASARMDFPGEAPFYIQTTVNYSTWEYARSTVFLIEEQKPPFLQQRELNARVLFGYPVDSDIKFEFGGAFVSARDDFFNTRSFSDLDTMDRVRFRPAYVHTAFEKNSLDRKQFATRGTFFHTSFGIVLGNEHYAPGTTAAIGSERTKNSHAWVEYLLRYKNFFSAGSRFNPGFTTEVFLSHRPAFSNYTSTLALAKQYSPFPTAQTMFLPEFRANNYMAAGLKTIFTLSGNASLQAEAHLFQPLQRITSDENQQAQFADTSFDPKLLSNIAFVYHTAPGPLSISLSYFHNEQENWVFMVNFGFLLFNRQSFM